MEALRSIVENYSHPCGLYAAIVCDPTPKQKTLARYLCPVAHLIKKRDPTSILHTHEKGVEILYLGGRGGERVTEFGDPLWEDLE